MKRSMRYGFCVVALMLGMAAVLRGQTGGGDDDGPPALDDGIAKADLANGLIEYGRATKTPEALVTAAMILTKLPVVDYSEKPVEKPKVSEAQKTLIQDLLKEAASMRDGDKVLKELVGRAEDSLKEASRGFGNISGTIQNQIKKIAKMRLPARVKTSVATIAKKKNETISATADNRAARVGVVNISTGTEIASGVGSVAARAPANGNYRITATPPGTLAIESGFSLK